MEIKEEVKAKMTVQDWVDYLKWYIDVCQDERKNNLHMTFALGAPFIGSILTIVGSISTANWLMLVLGAAGFVCFGVFLFPAIRLGNISSRYTNKIVLVLSDVMMGDLDTPEKIKAEYRKIIAKTF